MKSCQSTLFDNNLDRNQSKITIGPGWTVHHGLAGTAVLLGNRRAKSSQEDYMAENTFEDVKAIIVTVVDCRR
jgi:hypothetical protein